MTDYNSDGARDRGAVTTAGALVPTTAISGALAGMTLASATTYYIPVGGENAPTATQVTLLAVQMRWAAAFAAVITVETCNFPATLSARGVGSVDVSDFDTGAGNWIQENPSTAVVATNGTGNTATALTITAGGTNAGGFIAELGNLGARRIRLKVVVTTGALVRCSVNGKQAA